MIPPVYDDESYVNNAVTMETTLTNENVIIMTIRDMNNTNRITTSTHVFENPWCSSHSTSASQAMK